MADKPVKIDFDHHTHTVYSKHANPSMTVANSLQAAREMGLSRYVVLEHVPEISADRRTMQKWRTGQNERVQLDAIARDLEELEPQFSELQILRGVEVDADPFALDGSAMLEDFSGIDVVVGSTHVFPGGEAFWYDPIRLPARQGWQVALKWRDWAVKFVESGRIHVLAHPGDLVGARRLAPTFDKPRTLELFDPILEAMKKHGVAFELNELLSGKLPEAYRESYPALVRRAKSHGLSFSISSDAHAPQQVGRYEWVYYLMEQGGVTMHDLWSPESVTKK